MAVLQDQLTEIEVRLAQFIAVCLASGAIEIVRALPSYSTTANYMGVIRKVCMTP